MKFMKNRLLTLVAVFAAALTLTAGGKEDWHTDFDQAMKVAKEEKKVLMVEFHGSDWCPPCMKLNKEVLSTDAFKGIAESSLILVNADFPRKTALPEEQQAHNEGLAKRFGIRGFPTVVLINHKGEELDRVVGFPRGGLDGFLAFLEDHVPGAETTGG